VTGRALVVQANAMPRPDGRGGLPLPDASVHLCVTSPPYWRKRKYAITGPGEIGNEPNWQLYLENLWTVTDELLRVLHPSGSIWVNLGDTRVTGIGPEWLGIPVKSRLLLPERYRIGCQDRYAAQGVIVRQVQIHDKANGLPESTKDRTRDSHEDWVQIVKRRNYYAALDTLREPTEGRDGQMTWEQRKARGDAMRQGEQRGTFGHAGMTENPLGKLPGSVWRIPSDPLSLPSWLGVDHYAAFSPEWPRRLVLAFSPPGICVECGEGRRPVVDKGRLNSDRPQARRAQQLADEAGLTEEHLAALVAQGTSDVGRAAATQTGTGRNRAEVQRLADEAKAVLGGYTREFLLARPATILGWACSCTPFTDHPGTGEDGGRHDPLLNAYSPRGQNWGGKQHLSDRPKVGPWREFHLEDFQAPPTRPAIVLDPFSGVGTTCLVARALGRIGIGVDLSHAYSRAARWRVFHSGDWQQVIERTTGRPTKPLPKHDPDQERLAL
jgi:DNA methylase